MLSSKQKNEWPVKVLNWSDLLTATENSIDTEERDHQQLSNFLLLPDGLHVKAVTTCKSNTLQTKCSYSRTVFSTMSFNIHFNYLGIGYTVNHLRVSIIELS